MITYQEWMVDVGEYCIFTNYVVHLPKLDDVCLLESLHGVEIS